MRGPAPNSSVRALEDEGIALAFGIPGHAQHRALRRARGVRRASRAVLVTDEQSASLHGRRRVARLGTHGVRERRAGRGPHARDVRHRRGVHGRRPDARPRLRHPAGHRQGLPAPRRRPARARASGHEGAVAARARGADLYDVVRRACRHRALRARPGPVFVEIPADQYLFRHEADLEPARARGAARRARAGADVERAAEILRAGEAPAPLRRPRRGEGRPRGARRAPRSARRDDVPGQGRLPRVASPLPLARLRRRRAGVRARRRRLVRRDARDRLPLRRGRDGQLRAEPAASARPRGRRPLRARAETSRRTSPSPRTRPRSCRRSSPASTPASATSSCRERIRSGRAEVDAELAKPSDGRVAPAPPAPRAAGDVRRRDDLHVRQRERDVPRGGGPAARKARAPPRARGLLVHGLRGPGRDRREARVPRTRRSSRSRATGRSS